jgi:hypothetical protein
MVTRTSPGSLQIYRFTTAWRHVARGTSLNLSIPKHAVSPKPRALFTCLFLFVFALAVFAVPVAAHHSVSAEFDLHKQTKITGTLRRVEWGNPHTLIFIDVKDLSGGKTTSWALELPSRNVLERMGWSRDPFKAGIVVTVDGYPAKDGSPKEHPLDVISSDGRVLYKESLPN